MGIRRRDCAVRERDWGHGTVVHVAIAIAAQPDVPTLTGPELVEVPQGAEASRDAAAQTII